MYQLIRNVAMAAALVALIAALWQGWGLLATLKKMVISYLGFFIFGAIMALVVKSVPRFEEKAGNAGKEGE